MEQQIVCVLVRLNYSIHPAIQMCSRLNKHFWTENNTLWLCVRRGKKLKFQSSLGRAVNEWNDTEGCFCYLFIYDMRIHKCLPSYVVCCRFFPSNILFYLVFFWAEKGHKYVSLFFYTLEEYRFAMFRIIAGFGFIRIISFSTWFAAADDEWIVDFFGKYDFSFIENNTCVYSVHTSEQ